MNEKWKNLMSVKRYGQEKSASGNSRSEFQKDYDRMIFSATFRRLQHKTQVHPLPESDFIHTRLTHSLETSCVGRSLGTMVGEKIIKKNEKYFKSINLTSYDFGVVLSVACLSHDIGNPPFGHAGESAISDYFLSEKGKFFLKDLNEKEKNDLQNFEGNAAGLRLMMNKKSDLKFTYATLGTFTKYPKESFPESCNKHLASEKKYGIFQSDIEDFNKIAKELNLIDKSKGNDFKWKRHPLAFLMEAADDICYNVIDLEDGYKLNIINIDEIKENLFFNEFNKNDKIKFNNIKETSEQISYLRAKAINKLVNEVVEVFMLNYKEIMNGTFDLPLTEKILSKKKFKEIKNISKSKIYNYQLVREIEAAGFEVLGGLLDVFLDSVLNTKNSFKNEKIKSLIPRRYIDSEDSSQDKYEQILNVVEYVSGMTDIYAVNLYRKIKGISLPHTFIG